MENTRYNKDIYYYLSVLSFTIYLFFDFFGTSLPFRPRVEEIGEISTSNVLNQIVYSILFLTSLVCVFVNRSKVFAIIRREKFLTLFIIWCVASIAWSVDPISTFKKVFRTITLFTITFSILTSVTSLDDLFKFIKPILYLYVFSSLVVCFIIPGAIDPQFSTWRGFTGHKNLLGQESVICTLLSFFIYRREKGYQKMIALISLIFSITLLFGARSATSITSFLLVSGISSVFLVDKIFKPIGLGRTVSIIALISLLSLFSAIILFTGGFIESFTGVAGKDVTFSGRTDLWLAMMYEISKHPFIGYGYQAFWSLDNPSLLYLYEIFIWLPTQAHNGYIDIINEVGIIGFILFLFSLIRYFFYSTKLDKPHPWKWLIIATLIINFQESTLFRPGHLIGEMLVISYFILYAQILEQEKIRQFKL